MKRTTLSPERTFLICSKRPFATPIYFFVSSRLSTIFLLSDLSLLILYYLSTANLRPYNNLKSRPPLCCICQYFSSNRHTNSPCDHEETSQPTFDCLLTTSSIFNLIQPCLKVKLRK